MSLNLATAKTLRQYGAIEGANIPPIDPAFNHEPPSGSDAIKPSDSSNFTADASTDLLSTTGHGLLADTPVRFTSTTTLPAGLSAGTTYYVISSGLTADVFKVATAVGGSAVNITDAGTGTHSWSRYLTAAEQDMVDRWRLHRLDPSTLSTRFIVDPTTDLITSVIHGLAAGDTIRFLSTDTLPAGLSAGTTYYVIASGLTTDAFKVSATVGGSAIDVTDIGTGLHAWQRYLPVATATITAWLTYEANPKHTAWVTDNNLQRYWQWRWRNADHADVAAAAVPPAASTSGSGSGAPTFPAGASPN